MKAMRVSISIFTFVLACAASASAQQKSAPVLPLPQVLQQARDGNPEIKAARADWQTAQARVLPEKTWKAPQVGIEYWGFQGASLGSASEKWYDIAQDVPFPGKLHFKGAAADHEARRQEEIYKGVELDVVTRVKTAYYRYLFTTKARQTLEENAEVMRAFAKVAEAKYATGKSSQSDVLRAQVELSKTLGALLTLEQEQDSAQAQLNALLDRGPDEPLGTPEDPGLAPLHLAYKDLEDAALSLRPEVRAAGHHIEHMKANLSAQRAEYLPDFSLQYTRRTRDGMASDSIAMIKMSLPFLYFWRQRAQTQGASAELGHAEAMLRSEQNSARSDVKSNWTKVQAVGRLVELYSTSILPQAEQSVKVTETAYQSDRVGFLDLLDSQRALLEFRLDFAQYVSQYGQSVAELERTLGVDLATLKPGTSEEHSHDPK
jgi:cobalt-zinc-cadmium efflux system outer membrane protein